MSMRFKIFQSVPYADSKGVTYRNHKVFIKNKPYWFSEKDYVNQPELLLINDNHILIAETQKDLYEIKKSSKKNGEFYSVVPLCEIDKTPTKANIEEHNQITLGSILKTVIPFKEPDFFDEPYFDEPDFLDEPDIKNALYRGTAENLPLKYKHLLDDNEQQVKTDDESTEDPDINEMDEPDFDTVVYKGTTENLPSRFKNLLDAIDDNEQHVKTDDESTKDADINMKDEPDVSKAAVRGSFKNLLSSFDHQLAKVRDNKQTDSSNILLEEFMDVDYVFLEQIEGNEKKSSLKIDLNKSKQNQQATPLDAKIQFINGLVAMASREKINNRLRERLFNLVSKELDGQKGREDKIFEEINNIKKILMDGLGPVKPPVESGRKENPHTPRSTAIFLSNFKYDNDSRLKELIHRPDESYKIDSGLKELIHKPDEFTDYQNLNDLLLKVKNHPALSSAFGYRNKSNFESIHLEVRSAAISLIKEFETVIRSQEKGQVIHPFAQSPVFRQYAEDFKRNFRFGSGEFDTKLSSVIKTAAIGTISSFKYDLILDQENVFDIKASFFSWLPSLKRSITHIFNEINTHSNINGTKTFEGKKIIRVTANVNHDSEMIEVNISDELSISSNAPVKVLENLRNSSLQLDKNLKALCNWSVFMDFENVGYELRVLSDKRNEWEIEPIVKLDSPNNAFINKLSFYRI